MVYKGAKVFIFTVYFNTIIRTAMITQSPFENCRNISYNTLFVWIILTY